MKGGRGAEKKGRKGEGMKEEGRLAGKGETKE